MSFLKKLIKKFVPATYFKIDEEGQHIIGELKKENIALRKDLSNLSSAITRLQTSLGNIQTSTKNIQSSLNGFQNTIINDNINFKDTYVTKSEKTK